MRKFRRFGKDTYRFKRIITLEKKNKISTHPHSGEYFYFEKCPLSNNFNWFVKTTTGDSLLSKYTKKKVL